MRDIGGHLKTFFPIFTHRKFEVEKSLNLSPFFSLGDGNYKPYVCSDPDVTTIEMNETEDFLIGKKLVIVLVNPNLGF